MAVRVLLVLTAFALLYGCGQTSSPVERQEDSREATTTIPPTAEPTTTKWADKDPEEFYDNGGIEVTIYDDLEPTTASPEPSEPLPPITVSEPQYSLERGSLDPHYAVGTDPGYDNEPGPYVGVAGEEGGPFALKVETSSETFAIAGRVPYIADLEYAESVEASVRNDDPTGSQMWIALFGDSGRLLTSDTCSGYKCVAHIKW